jgi:flagellum-specific ATP synthase
MSRITATARALFDSFALPEASPDRIGRLVSYDGLTIEATGLTLPVGSAVRVAASDGRGRRAEVVGLLGTASLIMPLEGNAPFATGAAVALDRQGKSGMIDAGPLFLGRIIDGSGDPIDGRGPIAGSVRWPLAGRQTSALKRGRVTQPFDTGVRAINALLTAGVGQRITLIAGSGVGKSVLMGQMLAGSDADVIVIGLIGERAREVSDFIATKLPPPVMAKSVVVAVPADHAPLLRLRAAMRATALAEAFRAEGKNVLLLIDSLTRVAHAQREIGLALGEPPTVKGYPPSALGLIPRLVERAGVDADSGGAITAIYTVLADGDDTDDPIVDAARAIADGHIVLSRSLAEQSVYPAIDIARSLSRVMSDVVSPDHLVNAAEVRRHWSTYEAQRDLILMGAYAHGSDAGVDDAIAIRPAILDFIRQTPGEPVPMDQSLSMLSALTGGAG